MPDPALSQAICEAYASAPSDVVILHTLEINHAAFTQPIRVVRNFPDTVTWTLHERADVAAVLDPLDDQERAQIGLIARLEDTAPHDAGQMVVFIALAFDLDLPPVDTIPVPEITVTMDNVGREIADALDAAAESPETITLTYRPYLSTDIDGPQMDPPVTLTIAEVEATPLHVTARARLLDIGTKAFPGRFYTARDFPGLVR